MQSSTDPKPILRVESRELLKVRDEQDEHGLPLAFFNEIARVCGLSEWDSDLFEIREIGEDENYLKHYQDRLRSISEGAKFLLESQLSREEIESTFVHSSLDREELEQPLPDHTLLKYFSSIADQFEKQLQAASKSDYKEILKKYIKRIEEALRNSLPHLSNIKAKEMRMHLDLAEQFAIALRPRPNVVTIMKGDEYVGLDAMAFVDKPLSPFSHSILEELAAIKIGELNLPNWFNVLNDAQKFYLKKFLDRFSTIEELSQRVNAFSSRLRLIPVPSNYGTHTLLTCKEVSDKAWVVKEQLSLVRSSHIASRSIKDLFVGYEHADRNLRKILADAIDSKLQEFRNIPREELLALGNTIVIPIFFQTLISPMKNPDQGLHEYKQMVVSRVNKEFESQRVPYESQESLELFEGSKSLKTSEEILHEMNAARIQMTSSDDIQSAVITSEESVAEVEELMTPSRAQEEIEKLITANISQLEQEIQRLEWILNRPEEAPGSSAPASDTVEFKFVIFPTNHPLNLSKALTPSKLRNVPRLSSFIEGEALYKDSFFIEAYKLLLQSNAEVLKGWLNGGNPLDSNRELYIASLEQIVCAGVHGISIGSCVSGKDRKAIEIMHTAALKTYYDIYKKFPPLNIQEDYNAAGQFASIFAKVFCSMHHQFMAEFNAPGSFGTKTPQMYLPKYLQEAVEKWYQQKKQTKEDQSLYKNVEPQEILKMSNSLASLNDVIKAKSKAKFFAYPSTKRELDRFGLYKKTANTISPEKFGNVIQVLNEHVSEINEKPTLTQRLDSSNHRHARFFEKLLTRETNDVQRALFLYALVVSKSDPTLQKKVVKALGYNNAAQAQQVAYGYLREQAKKFHIDPTVLKPKELINRIRELVRTASNTTAKKLDKRVRKVIQKFSDFKPSLSYLDILNKEISSEASAELKKRNVEENQSADLSNNEDEKPSGSNLSSGPG